MLVEFWDFCRVNSLRTLPYLKAWHERYADDGLRVVGIHSAGFEPSRDPDAVRAAVARLGIEYPVLIDAELESWDTYGIQGWPSRYLWDGEQRLADFHVGEGGYAEAERAIQAAARRRARAARAGAPRGRAGRAAAGADRGPARPVQRPLRGRRRVGGAVGQRAA